MITEERGEIKKEKRAGSKVRTIGSKGLDLKSKSIRPPLLPFIVDFIDASVELDEDLGQASEHGEHM